MKSNTEYVIGALYNIDGIHEGRLIRLDEDGDPLFKMEGWSPYMEFDDGLTGFSHSTPDDFELIDDES